MIRLLTWYRERIRRRNIDLELEAERMFGPHWENEMRSLLGYYAERFLWVLAALLASALLAIQFFN